MQVSVGIGRAIMKDKLLGTLAGLAQLFSANRSLPTAPEFQARGSADCPASGNRFSAERRSSYSPLSWVFLFAGPLPTCSFDSLSAWLFFDSLIGESLARGIRIAHDLRLQLIKAAKFHFWTDKVNELHMKPSVIKIGRDIKQIHFQQRPTVIHGRSPPEICYPGPPDAAVLVPGPDRVNAVRRVHYVFKLQIGDGKPDLPSTLVTTATVALTSHGRSSRAAAPRGSPSFKHCRIRVEE